MLDVAALAGTAPRTAASEERMVKARNLRTGLLGLGATPATELIGAAGTIRDSRDGLTSCSMDRVFMVCSVCGCDVSGETDAHVQNTVGGQRVEIGIERAAHPIGGGFKIAVRYLKRAARVELLFVGLSTLIKSRPPRIAGGTSHWTGKRGLPIILWSKTAS